MAVTGAAQEEPRGSTREAATEQAQLMAQKLGAKARVYKSDFRLSVRKHVLWLWAPEDDAPLGAVKHSCYQLLKHGSGPILSHAALALQVIEHVAFAYMLHNKE